MAAKTAFEEELEIFRTEEEVAQQYFFAYLSVRSLAAENQHVLEIMNDTPLFWITAHHAMLLSAFIALGRIFDQNSKHNIDRLVSTAANNMSVFTEAAQMARLQAAGVSQQVAAQYVTQRHELTAADLRALRKDIKHWRRVYEDRYQEVRHKAFAHREVADTDAVNKLLANARIDELKELFAFLSALYEALWEQFYNGRKFSLHIRDWVLPDPHSTGTSNRPGETVYREGQEALLSMRPRVEGSAA